MKRLLALLLLATPAWAVDYSVEAGQESVLLDIFVGDSSSTTGAGLTGLAYNSGSLSCYYHRSNGTEGTAISLATMTAGTWATGGFVQVDATDMPGVYQLGIPNAAFAAGATYATIQCKGATNMVPTTVRVQIAPPVEVASAQASAISSDDFAPDGTAQSGTSSTIRLASAETYANDELNGNIICVTGGTGRGQCRLVTDYTSTNDTASVEPNWTTSPSSDSEYVVVAAGYIPGAQTGVLTTSSTTVTKW